MSLNIDGVDDTIACPASTKLDNLSPVTYAVWAWPDTAGESSFGRMFDKNQFATSWFIRTSASAPATTDAFALNIARATTPLTRYSGNGVVTYTGWNHYCLTWDGILTSNAGARFWKNAIETAYNASGGAGSGNRTSDATEAQYIGNNSTGSRTFDGHLAFAHIYNRELRQNEIRQIMRFPGSITRNLLVFLPLWGISVLDPDYSGNALNGTVTGAIKGTTEPPINGIFRIPTPQLAGVS